MHLVPVILGTTISAAALAAPDTKPTPIVHGPLNVTSDAIGRPSEVVAERPYLKDEKGARSQGSFAYGRTWEFTYKTTDGLEHLARFAVPNVPSCPESGDFLYLSSVIYAPAPDKYQQPLSWSFLTSSRSGDLGFVSPTIIAERTDDYWLFAYFDGVVNSRKPHKISGKVVYSKCLISETGSACLNTTEASVLRAVKNGERPDIRVFPASAEITGQPFTYNESVYMRPAVKNPVVAYFSPTLNNLSACGYGSSTGREHWHFDYSATEETEALFTNTQTGLNESFDVAKTSVQLISEHPFHFQWNAAGDSGANLRYDWTEAQAMVPHR